jgi:hypothetical protein
MPRAISIDTLPMSAATRRRNAALLGIGQGVAKVAATALKPRLRQSSQPKLNANETAFLAHLQGTLPGAIIHSQAITLKLANGVRYIPDFVTYQPLSGRLVVWEVKGTRKIFDGAGEKLKLAANIYRGWVFYLVWCEGGAWQQQLIRADV